jgi:hypothetical protein
MSDRPLLDSLESPVLQAKGRRCGSRAYCLVREWLQEDTTRRVKANGVSRGRCIQIPKLCETGLEAVPQHCIMLN